MGPFFAVLLGRYIVQIPEQHLMNEIQPKSIRTLKIPDFYSEYREKGEGYAAFLGSSIVAKVGLSANDLGRCFPDDGRALFFEGDVPRVTNQELREQSRVWRERPVGDNRNVSSVVVAMLSYGRPSRCRLISPPTPLCGISRNGMKIFILRCGSMTDSFGNMIRWHDPVGGIAFY